MTSYIWPYMDTIWVKPTNLSDLITVQSMFQLLYVYKHGSVNSADKHEEHSRPASIWVEMKWLKNEAAKSFFNICYKWEMAKELMQ